MTVLLALVISAAGAVLFLIGQRAAHELATWWRDRRPAPIAEPASHVGPVFDPRARLFDWAADCPHLTNNQKETPHP